MMRKRNGQSKAWSTQAALAAAGAACVFFTGMGQNAHSRSARDKAAGDIVLGEFEGATFGNWTATGTAFGTGPVRGAARLGALEIQGAHGDGVASSENKGDTPTGTLTSPPFIISRDTIAFVIGGGPYERDTCLNLIVDGKIVKSTTGAKSDTLLPQSWDVRELRGKTARLQLVDTATGDWGHITVDHIVETDRPDRLPANTAPLYQEKYRPQFHFTARQWTENRLNPGMREEGWLNDLNGLVYYEGEYHLFAQRWNKCWIHAVSRALVHWTELEPAFWEEKLDSGVQSGSCVIDYTNSSGLSPDKKTPPMVAFWSRNDNKSQCISYSLDKGRTWTLYAKNPVLVFPERDPKVFWHAPTHKWVMMLYGNDQYHVFTSTNLLDWHDEKKPIANSFECPDMFALPIEGEPQKKWVLVRGNGKYSIGDFDGVSFKEETSQMDSDAGPNFYATQTWNNTETGDGRRIQTAWMRGGAYPDMPFNQQVTFPCELTLHRTARGLRLFRRPIREIALLHTGKEAKWESRALKNGDTVPLPASGDLLHIKLDVAVPDGATLTLNLLGVPVVLTHNTLANGGAPISTATGALKTVEVLVDRTSIEAFANDGDVSLSRCFLPANDALSLHAEGNGIIVHSLSVVMLKSAWKDK